MIAFDDIVTIVADSFFNGSVDLAGIVIFTMVLAVLFSVTRNPFATMILSLPVAFIFSTMGFLGEDLLILLIIVIVLGLAYTSRNVWSK